MIKVAPSLLASDFLNLGRDIEKVRAAGGDYLHCDVMDGAFVPNISFGQPVVKAAVKSGIPCDVHLMIEKPEKYIEEFAKLGARIITVHAEACVHLNRQLRLIRECGCLAGVALNPHTPVEVLADIIQDVDLVLIMTVNPGYGGQKFIEHSYAKLLRLQKLLKESGSKAMVEVDGGVNFENAEKLVNHGVNVLVAGSTVFGAPNRAEAVLKLKGE